MNWFVCNLRGVLKVRNLADLVDESNGLADDSGSIVFASDSFKAACLWRDNGGKF